MFDTHTTKAGEKCLVCQMTDAHLYNTINMLCNKIQQYTHELENDTDNTLVGILTDDGRLSREEIKEAIKFQHELLMLYLPEAFIRSSTLVSSVAKLVQLTYKRDKAVDKKKQKDLKVSDDFYNDFDEMTDFHSLDDY